jgi:CxxC-x17-CxxC domain-containing protein
VEKFKADSPICQKTFFVPFEPQKGRPLYCRECLAKIKEGKIEPIKTPVRGKQNMDSGEHKPKKEVKDKQQEIYIDNKQDNIPLRELLKKVERGELDEVDQKKPTEKHISLSQLKEKKEVEVKEKPAKEATDEKRDSLRDAFAKIMFSSAKEPLETEKVDKVDSSENKKITYGELTDNSLKNQIHQSVFKEEIPQIENKENINKDKEDSGKNQKLRRSS